MMLSELSVYDCNFKRRRAETKDATIRNMLLQLLAGEQAKDVTRKSSWH
jgi:hypothetical protein